MRYQLTKTEAAELKERLRKQFGDRRYAELAAETGLTRFVVENALAPGTLYTGQMIRLANAVGVPIRSE